MEYAQHLITATQEIFSSMIMLDVAAGEPFKRSKETLKNSVSGIIGLTGTSKALLSIHLPNTMAIDVTTAFLGMEVQEVDEDVRDAIGELANMLGGNLKTALDPAGSNVQLSMPSVVYGEEYAIDSLADAITVTVPFDLDGKTFLVELQLRKES
ncbi:MAG TPA: chemotaxis protein CheX [Malonomonas sp.]